MLYYFIGNTLEQKWGTAKFTIYYLGGVVLTLLGAVAASLITGAYGLTVAGTSYINLSMFLAFATLFPDMQLLLLFIPIKIKWLAYLDAALFLVDIVASIGQGDNRFTPMQLCVYTSALANKGTRYKATFLNRVVSADYRTLLKESKTEVLSTLSISADAFKAYSEGMQLVTKKTDWTGTAYSTFKDYPISIAAKTGTAQHGQRTKSDHGAFVCYAPADNPRIAIAIYGEMAGHGSSLTTIAKDILDIYFDIGEVGDVPTYENKIS